MANITQVFEAAVKAIQALTDNQKTPMHVGEVMACWTYLGFVENIIVYEEVGLNTAVDPQLKDLIQDALKIASSHKEQIIKVMLEEGIPLPNSPEHKPQSDPNAVPLGVKFTDDELINALNINFVIAADMCANSASQCLRTDIGLMFLKFQTEKFALGFKAKNLMGKKGWLKIPPYYQPPGAPDPSP